MPMSLFELQLSLSEHRQHPTIKDELTGSMMKLITTEHIVTKPRKDIKYNDKRCKRDKTYNDKMYKKTKGITTKRIMTKGIKRQNI
jgi:hypothetical protein